MKIATIEDVRAFIKSIYVDYNIVFHPDDTFFDYITADAKPVFTREKSKELDALLERCLEVCEAAGEDIYDLGMKVYFSL